LVRGFFMLEEPPRRSLSYAVVTAVRDEEGALPRLAAALASQTRPFERWLIIDNGSTDETCRIADSLASADHRIELLINEGTAIRARGGNIAQSLNVGIARLEWDAPDAVVIADADVSFTADFFEVMLTKFVERKRLGIASGTRLEQSRGGWRARPVTGANVQAQCRVYRWECLNEIRPLQDHSAWDTVDVVEANLRGWETSAYREPVFRHHRRIGELERSRLDAGMQAGAAAHFLGYRPSYLLARSLFQSFRDPGALVMGFGYLGAWSSGSVRAGAPVRRFVREEQRMRRLPSRLREVLGIRR
jgi:glycosyltransferase involved in cell wall biosynthesis